MVGRRKRSYSPFWAFVRRHQKSAEISLVVITLVVFCSVWVAASRWYAFGTAETVRFKVHKTERVTFAQGRDASSKYLVFTSLEVFENTDSFWHDKFDSADMHGRLMPGKRYEALVYGWRVPVVSWYRNIARVREL